MPSSPIRIEDFLPKVTGDSAAPARAGLSLGIPSLDEALPDGGLLRGAVTEICSPNGLARSTRIALLACMAAQTEARRRNAKGESAWCAWVDPTGTLHAPGIAHGGVDLSRLLVVQPNPEDLARIAVRLVSSRVFSVVVLDRVGVPGAEVGESRIRWDLAARRLALAAEGTDTAVLMLSPEALARRQALPTAMRIELEQPLRDQLSLRVVKDRRGRLGPPVRLPLAKVDAPPSHPDVIHHQSSRVVRAS